MLIQQSHCYLHSHELICYDGGFLIVMNSCTTQPSPRMLGYSDQLCPLSSATDIFGEGTGPVWLNNLRCRYYDSTLDQCTHDGLQENWCPHSRDAAVICQGVKVDEGHWVCINVHMPTLYAHKLRIRPN